MLNSLKLQGRLVADPVFGKTNNGSDYANFRLAWSEKYKDKENKAFIDCRAFGNTALFCQKYFNQKGQEMIAEGRIMTVEWEKDGEKRSKLEANIDRVHFCGKRGDADDSAFIKNNDAPVPVEVPDGELPF